MNAVYIVDENYVKHAIVSITSLISNAKSDKSINIYVICVNISLENINILKKYTTQKVNIKIINLDKQYLDKVNWINVDIKHLNKTSILRILLPSIIDINVEKILYLDADTIILDSLEPLYSESILDKYAAVIEEPFTDPRDYLERLGLSKSKPYFNSGVILFNLKKMRDDLIQEKLLILYEENRCHLKYPDQDLLNIVLQDKLLYVHPKYNVTRIFLNKKVPYASRYTKESYFLEALKNPVIFHFVGYYKPWNSRYSYNAKYYYFYLNKSLLKDKKKPTFNIKDYFSYIFYNSTLLVKLVVIKDKINLYSQRFNYYVRCKILHPFKEKIKWGILHPLKERIKKRILCPIKNFIRSIFK